MAGILIVEDNSTIRMLLTAGIKGMGITTPITEARTIAQARTCLYAHCGLRGEGHARACAGPHRASSPTATMKARHVMAP